MLTHVRAWSLSDIALDRPVTFGMLLLAIVLLGVIGFGKMPLSYLPLQAVPKLQVRVSITRTSPEVLEREVIRPFEEEVASIRDVERIKVGSGSWGVFINLDFEPGTDLDARKLELRDRIERLRPELPAFVQNVELQTVTNLDEPMMELQIASGTDLSQDFYLIEERILRRIERLPGVARADLYGVSAHELDVAVDIEAVSRQGISMQDVGAAVRDARQGRNLGQMRSGERVAGVRSPGSVATPERFAQVALRRGADRPKAMDPDALPHFATLGQVADVSAHPIDERSGIRLNGRRAVSISIHGQAGASAVEVSRSVRAEVERIANDPALDDIDLLVLIDQGESILSTLGDLRNTGIYGGLLGIVVLGLCLHRFSTTFAASLGLPMSVAAAGAVLFVRGDELNCVVMLGLVLGVGMLVDNAVVIVEAISRAQGDGLPRLEAARLGAREVGFATIASTMSTIIVFVPLMVTNPADPAAVYMNSVGVTFTIALLASLVISQTAVPLLMGRCLPAATTPIRNPVLDWVGDAYGWLIGKTLRAPRLTLLLGLGLASTAVYPYSRLEARWSGSEVQKDNLPIRVEIAGSRGYEVIERVLIVVERALLDHRDEIGFTALTCSYSDFWGSCDVFPKDPFQSEQDYAGFEHRIAAILPEQVGVTYRLGESEFQWGETQDRHVVDFAIKGEDMGELLRVAEDVAVHLRAKLEPGRPDAPDEGGLDSILTPFDEGSRELHVILHRDRLERLGLRPADVADRIALSFQGWPLGTVAGPRGDLELRLRAKGASRPSEAGEATQDAGLTMLQNLELPVGDSDAGNGRSVPLGSVADIVMERRPWWIQRVDRQTEVRVKARFFSNDGKANWAAVTAAMADFHFPRGYTWGRGTKWFVEQEANTDMLINLGLCLMLVYAVMASLFESYLQPLGILITCILGSFGAFWGLYWTATTLDTTAVVGFFILIGVVVNNGIMLVDRALQLRAAGVPRAEALEAAGRQRIRPILMTALTTILGLVPMLIHHPTMAGIYYHAIAIVVAGGLLTSTIVTLIVLPAMYTMLEGAARSAVRPFRS